MSVTEIYLFFCAHHYRITYNLHATLPIRVEYLSQTETLKFFSIYFPI